MKHVIFLVNNEYVLCNRIFRVRKQIRFKIYLEKTMCIENENVNLKNFKNIYKHCGKNGLVWRWGLGNMIEENL